MKRYFSKVKRYWLIFLILLVVGGFLYFRSRATAQKPLTFVAVTRETIESTIEVPGKVDADQKASLKFLAGGKLTYLPVKEGQYVKKYQTIASVDARDLQKNLSKSLNLYMTERLDFEQTKDDRKDLDPNLELRRLAQKSQLALDNSVIDVELRDIAIRNSSLYAPIEGVVTSLPVKVAGVQVMATDIFEIVDPKTLLFDAEVDEIDIGKIKVGTPVRITLDAYPDEEVEGIIDFIGLKADVSSRSSGGTVFPVRVSFSEADAALYRLGMNGTMTIILDRKENVLSIPLEATMEKDGKTYVEVQDPQNPKKSVEKEITTGIESESTIEVLSGLSEGDQVVIPE